MTGRKLAVYGRPPANENRSAASLQKKQNIGASDILGGKSSLPAGPDDFSFSASQRKAKK
jgi:hypothetical protein